MGRFWLLASILLVPLANAAPTSDTTFTGDVDVYNVPDGNEVCAAVLTFWDIVLTLGPGPGPDIVALTVQGDDLSGAAVTTPLNRVAVAHAHTVDGCPPLTEVTGVYVGSGEVAYEIEWRVGGIPL